MWVFLTLIGILVVLLIVAISAYNSLVSLRQQTGNAWAQIDVQLKRRYDLIPNLVETVKGYMKHEQDTLEKVIKARNMALAATTVGEKATAEKAVGAALTGIFGLAEAYPDLKSNENMIQLQEELRGTENKIAFARQYYNDIVTAYNTKIEAFPTNIFANMGKFEPKELFELEEPAAREPVKVKF
ncbi:MAG: LemA family protein [Armatimonadetes bacterium]|uniref:LemA family protein n=1 Tax=Candidatus Nitrosymbiomonas proteolyticus TaxID=2608984 RepID=A0A809R8L0_9BACT|nr:MAG: LemA family protein [Armatimonadota bacterium]KXK14490.1 MAG: LemA family protein [Armatimonadetes bacterium OLB18]MBV6491575.1 Protein LemA [Fimbriimonadaceae bacterium]QOJ11938.1 MAG: LemA family protein [Chthonomonadaceae bacterium]BBO23799.1 LemA family protein [Candidatus Nitrosymbiomonas proteolyticus]